MKSINRRVAESIALKKLYGSDSQFPVWDEYGIPIVENIDRDKWEEEIEKIPDKHRSYIRSRIIHEYGAKAE